MKSQLAIVASLIVLFSGFAAHKLNTGPDAELRAQTPDCLCTFVGNTFPQTAAGVGALTESITCAGHSPFNSCTVSGNNTWTPEVNCCGPWDNAAVGSFDSCNGVYTVFANCSGATSNPESCTISCTGAGAGLWVGAAVNDCSGGGLVGALKAYLCKYAP